MNNTKIGTQNEKEISPTKYDMEKLRTIEAERSKLDSNKEQ